MLKVPFVLSLLLIGGCADRPSSQETPPTPQRALPVQALEQCQLQSVRDACHFRPEFANLTLDDQLAMMANCFEIIGPELRKCSEKRDRLDEWIKAGKPITHSLVHIRKTWRVWISPSLLKGAQGGAKLSQHAYRNAHVYAAGWRQRHHAHDLPPIFDPVTNTRFCSAISWSQRGIQRTSCTLFRPVL